ncbi:hypothetical protein AMS68_002187 [Peltaster fructicola]|uniref:DNA mismatch repair proteins mutS family domain-containing protein n=1 Tax=Peltaster fructicola TaxID=286661 RepID=A0A6H0XQB6_9PEZI|nr:hypothetical protein AMS68_002187 [Peltaster fructicola]
MLYRVTPGAVQDRHYGIKLAKVLPIPAVVIETAELVSSTLEQMNQRRPTMSLAIITARKRKLLLNLQEHLTQARDSGIDGPELTTWLTQLQREFVVQMSILDDEERKLVGDQSEAVLETELDGEVVIESIEQDVDMHHPPGSSTSIIFPSD